MPIHQCACELFVVNLPVDMHVLSIEMYLYINLRHMNATVHVLAVAVCRIFVGATPFARENQLIVGANFEWRRVVLTEQLCFLFRSPVDLS